MTLPSRFLLISSATVFVIGGILLLFAPELLGDSASITTAEGHLAIQILGAAWLGLAELNWLARGTMIGGIYGRPIVLANFAAYFVAATSILRAGLTNDLPVEFWVVGGIAAVFALAFGLRVYGTPPEFATPDRIAD